MVLNFRQFVGMALLCLSTSFAAFGQASTDTLRTYIFGHSLINHGLNINPIPSQETSVPHWFDALATEAGYGYAVGGQFGFINGHAANLPPSAQWGFDSVAGAWDSDFELFSEADFDNILITPANFIQYQPPHLPYYQDTFSPISATNKVFDWCDLQEDSLKFYVYENWPDMAGYLGNGFPPTASEWNQYNAYLNAGFHDWFIEYHDSLRLAHPNRCVSMVPVGPVISGLLSQAPFDQIKVDSLYEDDAPHGRPTIYFLAALATYMAMYEEPAPATFQVPGIIDPIVANNYGTAVSYIWNELLNFNDALGNSRVFCNSPLVGIEAENLGLEAPLAFPNPTSGRLTLRGDLEQYNCEVLDLTGRVCIGEHAAGESLDLSHLPAGLYLLRTRQVETGQMHLQRILKED